jgi:hypothetical protein
MFGDLKPILLLFKGARATSDDRSFPSQLFTEALINGDPSKSLSFVACFELKLKIRELNARARNRNRQIGTQEKTL